MRQLVALLPKIKIELFCWFNCVCNRLWYNLKIDTVAAKNSSPPFTHPFVGHTNEVWKNNKQLVARVQPRVSAISKAYLLFVYNISTNSNSKFKIQNSNGNWNLIISRPCGVEKFSLFLFSFLFILRSPAILRSRILRHKASALRLGQFSNFWEKLLKNLYSLMVTDMRRCILASVGSAVLALSTCVTVSKEEKEEASSALCFLFYFFFGCLNCWFTCCLLSLHNTALHFATLKHCAWVAGVDASYIYR